MKKFRLPPFHIEVFKDYTSNTFPPCSKICTVRLVVSLWYEDIVVNSVLLKANRLTSVV